MNCFISESIIHIYSVRLERKAERTKITTPLTLETNTTVHVNELEFK